MNVRTLRETDLHAIRELGKSSGFPYEDPTAANIEAALVVCDENGQLLMACAAERIVQLYLWSTDFEPAAKLHAIRLLHREMAKALKEKGYTEANAFLPPSLALQFGRRLERTFSWCKNWPSWCRRL